MTIHHPSFAAKSARLIAGAQSLCSMAAALILAAYLCFFLAALASGNPDAFDARHADIRPAMTAAIASFGLLLAFAIGLEIILLGREPGSRLREAMIERNDLGSAKSPVFIAESKARFEQAKAQEARKKSKHA